MEPQENRNKKQFHTIDVEQYNKFILKFVSASLFFSILFGLFIGKPVNHAVIAITGIENPVGITFALVITTMIHVSLYKAMLFHSKPTPRLVDATSPSPIHHGML